MLSPRPLERGAPRRALLPALCAALLLATSCGDGGTGPAPRPEPQNPVPFLSSLDPAALPQYSDSVTVTITGTGFVNGAVVRLNGAARLTSYVSPSQLTAVVPVAAMQEPATLQVTVVNPAPGGGESAALPLPVQHRVPTIRALSPGGSMQGDSAFTMTVEGTGFARASVIRWNGADRPTTFVDPYHLTTRVAAADLDSVGTAQVTVFNPAPGGGTAEARHFTIVVRPNPVPSITGISPQFVLAETGGTITVTGSGFMMGSRVSVGGFSPTPTFVSPTELRFTLEPAHVPRAGGAQVQVINPQPGGGYSVPVSLRVENPAPTLSSISPAAVLAGRDSVVIRLAGSGFVRGSEVLFRGFPLPVRWISAREVEFVPTGGSIATVGSYPVRVYNAAPGGGTSEPLTFTVENPAPVAQGILPAQTVAGQDSLVVRITGSGFVEGSVVRFEGAARPTRRVSGTELEAVLATADLDEPGAFALTVATPAPGGGVSQPVTLVLTVPVPVLASLPTSGASAGLPGFPLVVHGSGFLRTSEVRWNGQARETRFISSTRLEMTVTNADVAVPGTAQVSVHTRGGGTTAALPLAIRAVGPASFTDTLTLALASNDLVYDPHSDRIYASLSTRAGTRANTVVAIDPHTGAVTASVLVGSNPATLALSDDGTVLWVALEGTGQVRRLNLPALTLGTVFSLGTDRVGSMAVMPGRPGTVAIARENRCCSPSHEGVAIYDDGVMRPVTTNSHLGYNLVAFGESAEVLYGLGIESTPSFATLRVTGDGVRVERATGLSHGGPDLVYAWGRAYTGRGGVVDAARHEEVGAIPDGGPRMAVDARLGRIFFSGEPGYGSPRIAVYDMNTLQRLGQMESGLDYSHSIVRWGTDGLALGDDARIRILRTPLAGP